MRPRPRGIVTSVALPVSIAVWLSGCSTTDPRNFEIAAIISLKAIATAQTAYRTVCGNGGYAASLIVLQTPPRGGAGDGFIDAALGSSQTREKPRYEFMMTAGAGAVDGPLDCNGTKTVTVFYATAVPMLDASGQGPTRAFAVNQSGVVWQRSGAIAPTEPFGLPAIPVQ